MLTNRTLYNIIDKLKEAIDAKERQWEANEQTAYQRGFNEARDKFATCATELIDQYRKGLDDAWEAARTIAELSTNPKKRREMIGDYAPAYFVRTKTASEAIEAIWQWEQKQDEIQVGDVITDKDEKTHFLVFDISDKSYNCLSGKDFEPVYIGKDYISQYHNLKDRKDLKLVAEELLKQIRRINNG